ncbi:TIGR00341 family protein [Laspinema olomoucense]|uniref:TIGR00341 family protein n=1 Tax=Laspinema olomoucense TaxID=3231600 RepID=UPI0021BA4A7C|nr:MULTISPECIES: TIGR00341 family protein [unclassified Laspinema]MCT7970605.1 TIGR00341 family protein [Laspinema sp. D3d]MCT7996863.1 TIGR00341 family protein [Laspinema sp. D3c]
MALVITTPVPNGNSWQVLTVSFKFKRLGLLGYLRTIRFFKTWWNSNSGQWKWLAEKPISMEGLNRQVWRSSVPSQSFYILLGLSAIIATLGLLANSAATIIGAMIIAPLMGPILGIAYGMVMGNRRLLKRSALTLLSGVFLTIFTSFIICNLIGLRGVQGEIMARSQPTLLDLGVALAAGTAGAFAKSRRHIADALPGVAIAVALVPPLSVIGIGISFASPEIWIGSSLLFLTNLIGIILSGGLVFIAQEYGSLKRAKEGFILSLFALTMLGVPLGFSLNRLVLRDNVRRSITVLISQETLTFSKTDVRRIQVDPQGEALIVNLEVAAPANTISENQVRLVRDFLEERLEKPISLNVQVIPLTQFTAPSEAIDPNLEPEEGENFIHQEPYN